MDEFKENKNETLTLLDNIKSQSDEIRHKFYLLSEDIKKLERLLNTDPRMPFGKYKDTPLSEVPKHYIAWLFSSGSLDKYENRELRDRFKAMLEGENE